jgi:hypothetical protein
MMTLHLTTTEVELLDEVLRQSLNGLLAEIAHADDRAFRQRLQDRHTQLDALRGRLTATAAAS